MKLSLTFETQVGARWLSFFKKIVGLVFIVLYALGFSSKAWAELPLSNIQISDSRAVSYSYIPAQEGKPTIVMLNGLIYPLASWSSYIEILTQAGYGVVLVAYSTQPESLRETKTLPYYSRIKATVQGLSQTGLEIPDLAEDVMTVVDHLQLENFHLQTLSFGSIIGSYLANNYSDRIASVTLVSPAVMPSHRYTPYGESRHSFYVWQNEINMNPFYVPDYFYDLELYQTMRGLITTQYNTLDLEGIGFEYLFNGVYQMARSTKYFDLKNEAKKPWPQTNLILASDEDATLKRDQLRFWSERNQSSENSRLVEILDAPHAIPGSNPEALAKVMLGLLEGTVTVGDHKYSSVDGAWVDPKAKADVVNRSCNSFLRPKISTTSTLLTFK